MGVDTLRVGWERARRSVMFYGMLSTAARFGANALLIPIFLVFFSPVEQAVWWLLLALGSFANLADFGFGAAIVRVYSYLWGGAEDIDAEGLRPVANQTSPNFAKLRQLNATVRHLYLRIALLAMALLLPIGTLLLLRPIRAAADPSALWLAWGAFLLMAGYSLGTSHWVLACQGVNRVRESQAAMLWSAVAYFVVGAALLALNSGLMAMVAAVGVRGVVQRALSKRAYQAAMSETAVAKSPPDWNILRRLWPNAWKFGLLTVGGWLVANAGLLICSQRLGVRETASFGLTAQVGAFVVGLATLWLTVKWPEIAILRTQGRTVELSTLFARRFACCLGSYLVLASLLLLLGNPFLEWWGAKSRLLPAPQLAFLLFYLAQQMFYVQFEGLAFTENVVPLYGLNLLSGIVMTFAGWALAPGFGVWGVLLAAWLAESAGSAWLFTRRGFQSQTLSPRQFIRVALGGRA